MSRAITSPQFAVLNALFLEPNIDQRTLGDRVALDRSTVAEIVARLTARKLILWNRSASDDDSMMSPEERQKKQKQREDEMYADLGGKTSPTAQSQPAANQSGPAPTGKDKDARTGRFLVAVYFSDVKPADQKRLEQFIDRYLKPS